MDIKDNHKKNNIILFHAKKVSYLTVTGFTMEQEKGGNEFPSFLIFTRLSTSSFGIVPGIPLESNPFSF